MRKKGSLEPGKPTDLVLSSADPLTVEKPGIRNITADMTMVGGWIVHRTPNSPG
jgi:predicted amidohydrolase YtcJ